MSKQNKWAGSFGKVASGGSGTKGGNTYSAPKAGPAPRDNSSVKDNVVTMRTGPGDNMGMKSHSSHNDINAFTRGIKSRGPYGGPAFSSLNHFGKMARRSDTSAISSEQKSPSTQGGGRPSTRGTVGGSGKTGNSSKVGSGSAKTTQMAKAPRSNKSGSGYQASVG